MDVHGCMLLSACIVCILDWIHVNFTSCMSCFPCKTSPAWKETAQVILPVV